MLCSRRLRWTVAALAVLSLAFAGLVLVNRTNPLRGYAHAGNNLYVKFSSSIDVAERERLARESVDALAAVERRFGTKLTRPCAIAYLDEAEWKASGSTSEFSGGYYAGTESVHFIVIPYGASSSIARHEIGHAFVAEIGEVKTVIDEGIAQFLETDDGFHERWCSEVLEAGPGRLEIERFRHHGKEMLFDPLLREDSSARATGWLVVYYGVTRGKTLAEIARMSDESLPKRDELRRFMPEIELRYAIVQGLTQWRSSQRGMSLTSYWTLRNYANNPVRQAQYKEVRSEEGYLPHPRFAGAIGWLLACDAACGGKDPEKTLSALTNAEYLAAIARLDELLKRQDVAFFLALGVSEVESKGFDAAAARELVDALDHPISAREALLDTGDGKRAFWTLAREAWAYAYTKLAGGRTKDELLADTAMPVLTRGMVQSLPNLPKLEPTARSAEQEAVRRSPEEVLNERFRRAEWMDRRYEQRRQWWHGK